ncbi:tRNA nucleotidyltransferase/poly(A) polymerase [Desulforapulum autotrophicum HRM2]|uniref:tRNA nucleotidyltransferase/poly(A) polymerase n=1 Tax=Desulforapulum autotrophicum (strain ATCC 43914 / DSM 3382 / VKM B-1955 / HRM2) TaxID=177437 RepID=C0QG74_DESAH|nr:CCA tRNA nucleotidyltransferase [Desulforapulum autotrophicum]ACN17653.1 tRNA nucleotidyltransferase/poly(A) polymerase [Desulforapulum autotrophicum HRM2]
METHLPRGVHKILTLLLENQCRAFIAGGAVRDMVAGLPPADFDIVTDASLETIKQTFKNQRVKIVGKSFHVCLVNGIEVASFRGDRTKFPLADLEQRDFTINSMAWDPVTRQIFDPFSGEQDLKRKIIQFTGNGPLRIREDPLRMVRACRFVSQIGGTLAPETLGDIKTHGRLVGANVAKERIRMEILKAMAHDRPSLFFRSLQATGLLIQIFPCLDRLVDLDGGPFHGETVFEHSMMVGDALSPKRPLLRLAGFLHDAGKFDTAAIKEGNLTFHGHEKARDKIEADLVNLKFSTRERRYILSIIDVHMRPLTEKTTPRAVRRILALLESHGVSYQEFMRMRIADKRSNLAKQPYTLGEIRNRVQKFKNELAPRGIQAFTPADLAIDGNRIMALLNLDPGPEVGRIMGVLFERVLDDPNLNTPSALEALVLSLDP